jgi:spoIIIJ-associated protein
LKRKGCVEMMLERQVIETQGKNVEEAISIAKEKLNLPPNAKIKVDILEEDKKGFLGLGFLGNRKARVRVTVEPNYALLLENWLKDILQGFGKNPLDYQINIDVQSNRYFVEINGDNMGIVIGRRGEVMYALEHLLTLMLNKKTDRLVKVKLNVSNYKEERKKQLEQMAKRIAAKVRKDKKPIFLAPMNSYERMIIHKALKSYRDVYTFSKGNEPNRKVVVSPKNFNRKSRVSNYQQPTAGQDGVN